MEIGAVFGTGKVGKGKSKGKDWQSYGWHGTGYNQKGKDGKAKSNGNWSYT